VPLLPPTSFDSKEEKLQIKSAIYFMFMKSVGSLVRAHMMSDYTRPGADYQLQEGERLFFEGIYMTASVSTTEIMLGMVEEIILNPNGKRKHVVARYTDNYINLRLDNVAWIEFVDENSSKFCKNISKQGLTSIARIKLPSKTKSS
jgi:hypothetical protein